MTEKRFYVAESNLIDGYCVFDREKKYAFSPKSREADCLNDAHILNELNDENKWLKQTNQKLYDDLQETMGYLGLKSGIEKENEQLKKEKEYFLKVISAMGDYAEMDDYEKIIDAIDAVEQRLFNDKGF